MQGRNEAARGRCYETAFKMILTKGYGNPGCFRLCHGIATQTKPPHHRMGHAWLEWTSPGQAPDGLVILCIDGLYPLHPIPRDHYYEVGTIKPDDVVRYTLAEAKEQRRRHGHTGPWDPKILAAAHADE